MLYIRAEHEMPSLLAFAALVVAVEDAPLFEALDALDERSGADLRRQRERAVGLLDPDTVPVNLAVSPGGLDQLQVHVLRRLTARALAPVLPPEFVVSALQFLDCGPQPLVFREPYPSHVLALELATQRLQLQHGSAGDQVIIRPDL